eukprot:CAMPEP_0115035184 /NCGR_PEP_ID=MMETSP0216-20121206/41251_1 /TAXON_ID=223996 /ORGANISM="Protocruzia adherens, Strain Boccale" /LENGTH=167 /DNA_ID=CAMNT_0002414523 /DNA_START=21 /DNA_END=524 /DNA_ORIENTATION=+
MAQVRQGIFTQAPAFAFWSTNNVNFPRAKKPSGNLGDRMKGTQEKFDMRQELDSGKYFETSKRALSQEEEREIWREHRRDMKQRQVLAEAREKHGELSRETSELEKKIQQQTAEQLGFPDLDFTDYESAKKFAERYDKLTELRRIGFEKYEINKEPGFESDDDDDDY